MSDLLQHAAALELAVRDIVFPACGFGVAWCVVGIEALLLLGVIAAVTLTARAARYVWRHWQAVLFVAVILAAAVLAGVLGFG